MGNIQHPMEEELSAYIDDMLDVPAMRNVAEHVAECEVCRSTCLAFHRNKERMRQLVKTPAESAAFWAQAYARLELEQSASSTEIYRVVPAFRAKPALIRLKWVYSMAATFVGAAILVSYSVSPSLRIGQHPHAPAIIVPAPAEESDAMDISQLVWAHTSAASQQPLADQERQAMLAAENDTNQSQADSGSEEIL